jgi:pimeloyl-ACP methyl ester carboxylesterase
VRRSRLLFAAKLATGGILIYGALAVLAHLFYRRLLYPAAGRADVSPPEDASILRAVAADGTPVHALEFARPGSLRTVVYFHGNGEVVGDDVWIARELVGRGFNVVLVEYRGYGASTGGNPSEVGLYADAEAVLALLAARGTGPDRIVLWGMSLGTGVAAEMATRARGAALVLVAPYTSILDMAKHFVPILPAGWLMADRFETQGKAAKIRVPTLVFHGTKDPVVPFAMGQRVAAAIDGAELVAVPGGHHMDLFVGPGARYFGVARAFLDSKLGLTPRLTPGLTP